MACFKASSASGGAGRSDAPTDKSMTWRPASRACRFASSNTRNKPGCGVREDRKRGGMFDGRRVPPIAGSQRPALLHALVPHLFCKQMLKIIGQHACRAQLRNMPRRDDDVVIITPPPKKKRVLSVPDGARPEVAIVAEAGQVMIWAQEVVSMSMSAFVAEEKGHSGTLHIAACKAWHLCTHRGFLQVTLRDMPHARHDCATHNFTRGPFNVFNFRHCPNWLVGQLHCHAHATHSSEHATQPCA